MIKRLTSITAGLFIFTFVAALLVPLTWTNPAHAITFEQAAQQGTAKISDLDGMGGFLAKATSKALGKVTLSNIKADGTRLKKDAPKVSASMATALLVYSGIALKMLVDERLDAALHKSFMVEYEPGGNAHPHDHPLEEGYIIVEGEVEAWADGEKYLMQQGDFLWTGVDCMHAFYNNSNSTVRWLETTSPLPPARHSYKFARDWEYLENKSNRSEKK